MSLINNYNDPSCPIWVVTSYPYDKDSSDGYIFSCGYGYNWKKTWKLSGLPEPHIRSIYPCLGATYDKQTALSKLLFDLELYKPTFIIPLTDEILNFLVPDTSQVKLENSSIAKWAGSILTCKMIRFPHYIIATQPPDFITRNWDYHEIAGTIDLGHVKEEYDYWRSFGVLLPLPVRNIIVDPKYGDLIGLLNDALGKPIISNDIETIRPKGPSKSGGEGTFYYAQRNPGYPYTTAIATSRRDAFSFSLWDYTPDERVIIWRLFNKVLSTIPQIGQNYFSFDAHYLSRLGFKLCLNLCHDTLIRHHILWSCLEHSLQFQTKQYTRQPFYKDESQGFRWSLFRPKIMNYNALDSCVTFEIYEEQEKEFAGRPHLR